ncbi:fumarylacetoacetate hydrolase family protein [Haloprofundus salinisoli]|uniref:fumarylacetoacetate hydrolase family protein n=1 Tax=Haloprofundus salinisoli TaxID=2876193 RepID=UPI001CCE90DA|nr:fumarylacetoacetate hydrolase family protein [Haloprofundus salinisoli]
MRTVRFRDEMGIARTGELIENTIIAGSKSYDPESIDYLPPCEPTKIICQAGGYMDHREESGFEDRPERPELFLKGPNCVSGHGDAIELPPGRETVDFEGEFAVVIGEQCRAVTEEDAIQYVAGYTCVNDVSNRDDQNQERNWVRGKAFDGSLPIGPVLASPDEIPGDATLTLRHNGKVKQETSLKSMIFSVEELVANISELITLEPGDVIATGTPYGPDSLAEGDVVEVEFEGVGTLRNHVTTR